MFCKDCDYVGFESGYALITSGRSHREMITNAICHVEKQLNKISGKAVGMTDPCTTKLLDMSYGEAATQISLSQQL